MQLIQEGKKPKPEIMVPLIGSVRELQIIRDEAESILAEQGQIEVACEFCGQQYRFDPVDAAQIFAAPPVSQPPPPSGMQ